MPDATLDYLPFEALVTAFDRGSSIYLAERFAIVYGPSASALVSLEGTNGQAVPRKALLAFDK